MQLVSYTVYADKLFGEIFYQGLTTNFDINLTAPNRENLYATVNDFLTLLFYLYLRHFVLMEQRFHITAVFQ